MSAPLSPTDVSVDLLDAIYSAEGLPGGGLSLSPGAVPSPSPSGRSSPKGGNPSSSSFPSSLPATLGVNGSSALLSLRFSLPVVARGSPKGRVGGSPSAPPPPPPPPAAGAVVASAAGTPVVVKVGEGGEGEEGDKVKATTPSIPFLLCMVILLALALGLGLGYGLKPTLGGGTGLGSPTPSPAPSASSKMANVTKRVNVVRVCVCMFVQHRTLYPQCATRAPRL